METPENGQPAWRKKLRLALSVIAAACAIALVLFVGEGRPEEPIVSYSAKVNDVDCLLKGYVLDAPPAGYSWHSEPPAHATYLVGKTALEPVYISTGLADALLLRLDDRVTVNTPYGVREGIVVAVYAEAEYSLIVSADTLGEWFAVIE